MDHNKLATLLILEQLPLKSMKAPMQVGKIGLFQLFNKPKNENSFSIQKAETFEKRENFSDKH